MPPLSPISLSKEFIFVAYASTDLKRVEPIVALLKTRGWNVFWDADIMGGERWSPALEHALDASAAVLVFWTTQSVSRKFVLDEARRADDQDKLLSIILDRELHADGRLNLPLGLGETQALALDDWNGDPRHQSFQHVEDAIALIAGKQLTRAHQIISEMRSENNALRRQRLMMWLACILALFLTLGSGYFFYVGVSRLNQNNSQRHLQESRTSELTKQKTILESRLNEKNTTIHELTQQLKQEKQATELLQKEVNRLNKPIAESRDIELSRSLGNVRMVTVTFQKLKKRAEDSHRHCSTLTYSPTDTQKACQQVEEIMGTVVNLQQWLAEFMVVSRLDEPIAEQSYVRIAQKAAEGTTLFQSAGQDVEAINTTLPDLAKLTIDFRTACHTAASIFDTLIRNLSLPQLSQ